MEGWRAQRVYVRRAAMWVAVSERRTVLPISGERPHCMFRISCLLFAEIADIAKGGRWCHAFPVFLRFHTWIGYHPPRFIWGSPIVKGKRNACIWDVLFDKEWFTLSVYIEKSIYHTRRLAYQGKTSEMFQICLWENLIVIIMNQSKATSWLCSLNVARSSCRNVFSGCESLFGADDVRCKTCVFYYMTTPLSPYSK